MKCLSSIWQILLPFIFYISIFTIIFPSSLTAQTDSLDYYLEGGEIGGSSVGFLLKTDLYGYINGTYAVALEARKGIWGGEVSLGYQGMPLVQSLYGELWYDVLYNGRRKVENGFAGRISVRYYLPEMRWLNGYEGYYMGLLHRQTFYFMNSGETFRSGESHYLWGIEHIWSNGLVIDGFLGLGRRKFGGKEVPAENPSLLVLFGLQLGFRL
ncbi:MAG: hypothetical protein KDD99_03530 [Bacteroidetes bacterium]|nr:hypothetical protein [Bacteroidota bacterium]